jgi:hypothetical protein
MNNLAILPYICLHALQIQNIKRDVVKKLNITELNKNEVIEQADKEDIFNNSNNNDTKTGSNNDSNNYNNFNNKNVTNESTNIDNLPEPEPVFNNNIGTEL